MTMQQRLPPSIIIIIKRCRVVPLSHVVHLFILLGTASCLLLSPSLSVVLRRISVSRGPLPSTFLPFPLFALRLLVGLLCKKPQPVRDE